MKVMLLSILLLLAVPVLAAESPQSPVFGNVTDSRMDKAVMVPFHMSVAAADVNGDGCIDLYNGSHGDATESAIYLNDCTGNFTHYENTGEYGNYSQPPLPTDHPRVILEPWMSTRGARITSSPWFANLNGNALGLPSFTGADADKGYTGLYPVTGLNEVGQPLYGPRVIGCRSNSCLPLERNGEIVLVSWDKLYTVDGVMLQIFDNTGLTQPRRTMIFDADNDSYPDIVSIGACGYRTLNLATGLYEMQTNKFSPCLPDHLINAGVNHMVPLDFDLDGDLDLYTGISTYSGLTSGVQNVVKGDSLFYPLFYRNDGGQFIEVSGPMGLAADPLFLRNTTTHTTYANSIPVDINLDGKKDIVFCGEKSPHRPQYGYTRLPILLNNGTTLIPDRSTDFGSWNSPDNNAGRPRCAVGDFDNDGDIDVTKTHGYTGLTGNFNSIAVFDNQTVNGNHWLRVRAQGLTSDGLGTAITLYQPGTSTIVGYDQVSLFHSGSQNLAPHFGLGALAKVDVTVQFPNDGPAYTFYGVAADQDIIVRLNGDIVMEYIPGINPMLAAATTTGEAPPPEEPPPTPPTYAELEQSVALLLAEIDADHALIATLETQVSTLQDIIAEQAATLGAATLQVQLLSAPATLQLRRTVDGFEVVE